MARKIDKTPWPLAMSHTVHFHIHMPRVHDGHSPVEIWSQVRGTHAQLSHTHSWGCPVYVLNASLKDGFKVARFKQRLILGIYI